LQLQGCYPLKQLSNCFYEDKMQSEAIDRMEYRERIAQLNDRLRQTFWGGSIMMTAGVNALPEEVQQQLFQAVAAYDDFTPDNDPHGERDFGTITLAGRRFFWKVDYFDAAMKFGSEDPANPELTTRVLTLMLACEY
jgi:fermentation-respiration switch protein FrsA (DUF1100 family)